MRHRTNDTGAFEARKATGDDWPIPTATKLTSWQNLFYDPHCKVCNEPLTIDSLSASVCTTCIDALKGSAFQTINHCYICNEESAALSDTSSCLSCALEPPPLISLTSLYYFNDFVRALIHRIKFREETELINEMALMHLNALSKLLREIDLIIPIPLTIASIRKRGFSQTVAIARALSRMYDIPHSIRTLRRRKQTARQSATKMQRRRVNIKHCFISSKKDLIGSRVLLVDDVATSGATIFEAAEVLKARGVETIHGLTLARSERFSRNRLLNRRQA